MHTYAFNMNLGTCSIEILIFQITQITAVHGISPLAAEFLDIKMMSAHTYLLVRIECYTDIAMLYFIMVTQIAHSLYNLSYTCLVIGTEQRMAVGHDQIFTFMLKKFRKLLR